MRKLLLIIGLLLFILSSCTNSYVVRFESNGGNDLDSIEVSEGSTIEVPVIYRPGYILEGWYTSLNGGLTLDEKWSFTNSTVTNDLILYANWTLVNLEDALIEVTFVIDQFSYTISGFYKDEIILPDEIVEFNSNFYVRKSIIGWQQEIPNIFPNEDLIIEAITEDKIYTLSITDLNSNRYNLYMNSKDEIQNYINASEFIYFHDEAMTDSFDIDNIGNYEIELYYQNKIYLSYADWSNQELNQQLIDAFMEEYPHIQVNLRTDITGSGDAFTENLVTAAQAGLLPDVFATDNVPNVVNAGLTLDVAQYWDADADAQLVYDNIAATGVYYGKRFAVPSFQFLKGIMINLDIFEDANLTTVPGQYRIDNDGYPVKDWTFEEFVNIASAIKDFDPNDYQSGYVLGLDTWYGTPDFQQVWPMMDDAAVGYDTFDGTQFNYSTSDSWKAAMTEKIELHALTDGTTTRFDAAFIEANPELAIYHIQNGTVAMDIEGSWQFWVLNDAKENGINLGFWPYPQGSAGFFPPTILNYLAVSSKTRYEKESCLLAKWMSFGKAGFDTRLDILEENNAIAEANGNMPMYLDRFPVSDYPDVWERVGEFVSDIEGIDYILDNIENAKPNLDAWLPGYKDFWSWAFDPENPYNFDALVVAGASSVPTWAIEWERKINEIIQTSLEKLRI